MGIRKNQLLFMASALTIFGFILYPRIFSELASPMHWIVLALEVAAARMFAGGLRQVAENILPANGRVWYERPGSLIYLFISLICLATLCYKIDLSILCEHTKWQGWGSALLMLAITLLWIVIDDGSQGFRFGNQGSRNPKQYMGDNHHPED